uniref:fimbrial protein n=1 Tax=Pantoea sp. IMH TaxID=1267600 RepID=UPI000469A7CD|nr:fimbrial protein [Pantoea sp. IMH]
MRQIIKPLLKCRCVRLFLNGCVAVFALIAAAPGYALDPVAINISGTVTASASCQFNDETINLEFGNVYINKITGNFYKLPVPYFLNCEGDADGKNIRMRWVGTASSFDETLIATDVTGLGIKFLKDSSNVSANAWFDIDVDSPPSLNVVLIKEAGAFLRNGQEFNASATLEVAYL